MLLKELFVSLGLEVDEAAFAKGQLAAGLIEAGLKKIVEVGKEVIESFVENTKEAIEYGNKIEKTSQSIGIATDELQKLQYAAQLSDVSAEELSAGLGHLALNMKHAKEGSKEAAAAFKGIDYKNADGSLKTLDESLAAVAEKFASMPDGPEKTAKSMQIFGRAGKQLIPLLNEGASGLEELKKEAEELGLVMDEKAVKASEKLNDDLERLHMVGKGVWRQAIAPLLPMISTLVKRFLEWRKANAAVLSQKLQSVIGGIAKAFEYLGDTIDFVQTNMLAIKITAGLLLLTMVAVGHAAVGAAIASAAAWALAAAPFVAIAAAVAALFLLFDDVRGYYAGEDSAIGGLFKLFDEWLVPKSTDAWWLVQIKEFLRVLSDASRAILDFGEKAAAQFKNIGDMIKYLPPVLIARLAVKAGGALGDFAAEGKQRLSDAVYTASNPYALSSQESGNQAYAPSSPSIGMPGGSGGAGTGGINAPMVFNVSQKEGENSKDLSQRIGSVVKQVLSGEYSAALAGVRGQ